MRYTNLWLLVALLLFILTACRGDGPTLFADAGPDFTVSVGETPIFDGCASTGDMINFQWRILEAPDTMPGDTGKLIREFDKNCTFSLAANMGVEEVGEWLIGLEIKDDAGRTSTDTVTVTVLE